MAWLKVLARLLKKPPVQPILKLKFVTGIMHILFPKSTSRNVESKPCSRPEIGTIPAK